MPCFPLLERAETYQYLLKELTKLKMYNNRHVQECDQPIHIIHLDTEHI